MEEKKVELTDEQLDNVAGGLFVENGSVTCYKCGKMFPDSTEREWHEKNSKG